MKLGVRAKSILFQILVILSCGLIFSCNTVSENKSLTDPNSEFQKMDSIVFFHQGKFYHKSTAVLKILQVLSFPYNSGIVLFVFPRFIRDFVYDWVAKNRYQWFGKKAECWLPDQDLLSKFKP